MVITVPLESRTALHVHSLTGQEYIERLCRQAGLTVRSLDTRAYLGFGDDWRHAFLVAEVAVDRGRDRIPEFAECRLDAATAAL